jgi:hypothetical protein
MSAPLRLSAAELGSLAGGLLAISEACAAWGVRLGYSPGISLESPQQDVTFALRWDVENEEYYIDDRSGS